VDHDDNRREALAERTTKMSGIIAKEPAWLLAKVDQRLALMREKLGDEGITLLGLADEWLNTMAAKAGVKFFDYQQEALAGMAAQDAPLRACLYHKTGAGKSLTSLVGVAQAGYSTSLVIAPPSTHTAWGEVGRRVGLEVDCISHAKFRQKDYKIGRDTPVIADEFHMFGGHGGQGWKKMDKLSKGIRAPLILASATPNYNDAERVYCIEHVLDMTNSVGPYLDWLYQECNTRQNPFSMTPYVDEDHPFRRFAGASEYLAALPGVYYLADDLVWSISDISVPYQATTEFYTLGYDDRSHRIMASIIEAKHKLIFNSLVDDKGFVRDGVYAELERLVDEASTPTLIYANHATVARALANNLNQNKVRHAVVTGATPAKKKEAYLSAFRDGGLNVLVGTASLATGTDGLDKMCDSLIILDDTEDDSLRRQLVGRIMPRGEAADASKKQVHRLLLS
jgi:hypothetical protein